jgi:hypothetical protein
MQIRKSQATDEHGRKKRSDELIDDSGKAETMKAKFEVCPARGCASREAEADPRPSNRWVFCYQFFFS